MDRVGVGIVGCGKISPAYVNNLKKHFAHVTDVVACADVDPDRARSRADELGIPKACTVDELLADAAVELVVDLTNPGAHHPVSSRALLAGKHVFVEKPLATTRELARELMELAASKGLTLAGAVDTFMGAGISTCRRLVDEGAIGEVGTARAFISLPARSSGYLSVYGGPLYDLGPYYLTALLLLLGPVRRVTAFAELAGEDVDTASLLAFPFKTVATGAAALLHESGRLSTLHATVAAHAYHPHAEVFGHTGSLTLSDANSYGGTIVLRDGQGEREVPLDPGFAEQGRALGVAEQALSIRRHRQPLASGELCYHVLDVLHAVRDSALSGQAVELASACARPRPFDYRELAELG
jgi:predicted dehydrogenase